MDKRTSEWNTVAGLMQAENGSSHAPTEYKSDPRCHVCAAPDRGVPNGAAVRDLIDDLLLVPKTYASILKLVEPLMGSWPEDARISRYGLMRHSKNHLRWEQAAARRLAEQHARRVGKIDDASERMLSAEVVLETVQQCGYEAIIKGEVTPTVRDTLAASATLREIERESSGEFSAADALYQLDRIIQVMREVVPPEYHAAIADRLDLEPTSPPPSSDPVWDEIAEEMGEDAFR